MAPYAGPTALPPPHCPITIPNADSLTLSHDSHSTTLSQNFSPFSCLLPLTSNMLSSAKPNPIDLEFLNAHSMLYLSFMEAMSAALQKRFSEGFLKISSRAPDTAAATPLCPALQVLPQERNHWLLVMPRP